MFPRRKHTVGKPRRTSANAMTIRSLDTHVVPCIIELCQVVGIRAIFGHEPHNETVKQVAARRRQIEMALLEEEEVSFSL